MTSLEQAIASHLRFLHEKFGEDRVHRVMRKMRTESANDGEVVPTAEDEAEARSIMRRIG